MQVGAPVADPLAILPPELVLRVLEFASLPAIASLTAVSKAWHQFIDRTHQDAIYSSKVKASQVPTGCPRDLLSLSDVPTFSRWFENTPSWKSLCQRQTLLARNWASSSPVSRELVLQVGDDPVWRFRADLKRRFIVSTSHSGGLNVTDLDTGQSLWRLPSTLDSDDEDAVRPYAHLEYQDGMAVFDRDGDAVEVWQADLDGAGRGEFRRIAILDHDCQTRGFQLSYWTLCVVSTQGQGFVYDMKQRPPKLITHLDIERDAVGHLDQSEDAVMYSMGSRGYHVYNKASGEFMGILNPSYCTEKYHIRPGLPSLPSASTRPMAAARHRPMQPVSLGPPFSDRMLPIKLEEGPLPLPDDPDHVRNGEDEWGAGMQDGDLFVGVSRAGRVFICSNWRQALQGSRGLAACSAIIECESDGSTFDLGGWLSVRNNRLMFEVQDQIYIVALDGENHIQDVARPLRASYSLYSSSTPQLAVPVSFMALYDDAIMTTYTTLGHRQTPPNAPGGRIFPTKTIRIICLAPDSNASASYPTFSADATASSPVGEGIWSPDQNQAQRSRAMFHLLSMLMDEHDGAGDVVTDEE
ncbi:F-box protein [Aspergillus lucknowensis]|uniref:F-box domain-containing protein n=1 Tax=Aspergillus lucknowensis TaxID=176173 RepID=A0ABR4LHY3_9EURO